ncbi:hypothetical protein GUJ93_ZPchr0012g20897 [Zizania palustris]|uniref:Uncharacterized protein n=1 Tax=Zizania palustris TaxID=103762 RepID=A0A8J6BWV8_ZIZPA|nr:hypothetical protein GUJ93_ZPchr0012g20897 [Zizania palustris]
MREAYFLAPSKAENWGKVCSLGFSVAADLKDINAGAPAALLAKDKSIIGAPQSLNQESVKHPHSNSEGKKKRLLEID